MKRFHQQAFLYLHKFLINEGHALWSLLQPPGSHSSSPLGHSTILHSPRSTSNDLELNLWFFRLQGGSTYPCLPDILFLQSYDALKNHTRLVNKTVFWFYGYITERSKAVPLDLVIILESRLINTLSLRNQNRQNCPYDCLL